MVLSEWLAETLEKRKQRQISAAADLARAEERQKWVEWNGRREAAAAAGEDFNEPPPGASENLEETT